VSSRVRTRSRPRCRWSSPGSGLVVLLASGAASASAPLQFPASVELADPVGAAVTRLRGGSGPAYAGTDVAACGDVNGDGWNDFALSAPREDDGSDFHGHCFVLFGGPALTGAEEVDLHALDASTGFEVTTGQDDVHLGTSVACAGDVNADGFEDLLIGSQHPTGRAYVVFGHPQLGSGGAVDVSSLDGSDGFEIRITSSDSDFGKTVAGVGDVNDDGIDDLLVGAEDHGSVPLFFGQFADPEGLAVGDLNQDGALDVVVANGAVRSFEVLFGNGAGGFGPPVQHLAPDNDAVQGVLLDDFDGDGIRELVLATVQESDLEGRLAVYANDGSGDFAATPQFVSGFGLERIWMASGDVDGDGDRDLVLACSNHASPPVSPAELHVLRNDGGGAFVPRLAAVLPMTTLESISLGDLDDDTDLDVVVVYDSQRRIVLFENGGTGNLSEVLALGDPSNVGDARVADVNGDGLADLVCDRGTWIPGAGPFQFEEAVTVGGISPAGYCLADFDDDGLLDYASADDGPSYDGLVVMRGASTGGFAEPFTYSAPGDNLWLDSGDFDGDGDLDVVTLDRHDGRVRVYTNYGDGTFDSDWTGRAFVIFGGPSLGAGGSVVAASQAGFRIRGPHGSAMLGRTVAGLGDVNGDGIADFGVTASGDSSGFAGGGALYVFFGNSAWDEATIVDCRELAPPAGFVLRGPGPGEFLGTALAGGADLDQDGVDDLCLSSAYVSPEGRPESVGRAYVLFGSPSLGVAPISLSKLGAPDGLVLDGFGEGDRTGISVAMGRDVSGDGRPDLLIGSRVTGGSPSAHLVYGGPSLRALSELNLGNLPLTRGAAFVPVTGDDQLGAAVAFVGDVDGDGTGDFVLGAPRAETPLGNRFGYQAGEGYLVLGIPRYWSVPFCSGDGTGTPCACTSGQSGAGCANSTGMGAKLAGTGAPLVAEDELRLDVFRSVPGGLGILIQGAAANGGGAGNPFGNGLLCVSPSARWPVMQASAVGNLSYGPDLLGAHPQVRVGDTLFYQWWYRDTQDPCGGGFNLSNGWQVTWR